MDAKDEVKARLNIEDVISEYVQLKRSGRNFKGLSPFAAERTPSFMVSPEKQIWHDFSSGQGGDMFSFVMQVEGLDFKGALELLARKAGVELEQFKGGKAGESAKFKQRLYDALDAATTFYQHQFSREKLAYEYVLGERKFTKETALQWRLGYSPSSGSAVVQYLTQKGFSKDIIAKAGLSSQRSGGRNDMFRGRIMIPLCDPSGRVIGFTARLLRDNPDSPKYINTPQTPLYDKSRHVFGLEHAKEALRLQKFAVLVEGNLDVISSHQAGVKNVVATAGTALTDQHLKQLSRFTPDIRLCFDADKAGINATERAIPVASKNNVSLSILTIPSGKDPDELIQQDPTIWQNLIQKPQYAFDWLIERYKTLLDITTAQGKREFSDIVVPLIKGLSDSVEQDHYLSQLADILGVGKQALATKLENTNDRMAAPAQEAPKQPKITPEQQDRAKTDYLKTQDNMLALLLHTPSARKRTTNVPDNAFVTEASRQLHSLLQSHADLENPEDARLQALTDYAKILELQYEELYRDVDELERDYEVTRLHAKLIQKYAVRQNMLLQKKLAAAANDEERDTLLRQVIELNALRNKHV